MEDFITKVRRKDPCFIAKPEWLKVTEENSTCYYGVLAIPWPELHVVVGIVVNTPRETCDWKISRSEVLGKKSTQWRPKIKVRSELSHLIISNVWCRSF